MPEEACQRHEEAAQRPEEALQWPEHEQASQRPEKESQRSGKRYFSGLKKSFQRPLWVSQASEMPFRVS